MDKTKILALLRNKNFKDYSYNIFFFLIFSFFIIFAIRPNLITAFKLQKELQSLKLQNKQSEETILQILNYQSLLEKYRDKLYLLDAAVPSSPTLAKVISEVSKTASDSGLLVRSVNVESIVFKGEASTDSSNPDATITETPSDQTQVQDATTLDVVPTPEPPKLLSFTITVAGNARIEQIDNFVKFLLAQRRLKNIESFVLTSGSENTQLNLVILVYYL